MYGKMLVLTFEDNEDDMMSHILSLINTREEIIQMSGLNNHLLNFKGLKIDEVQRVIIRENQEIELTYALKEILIFTVRVDSNWQATMVSDIMDCRKGKMHHSFCVKNFY